MKDSLIRFSGGQNFIFFGIGMALSIHFHHMTIQGKTGHG
jgi:hypothetical protein